MFRQDELLIFPSPVSNDSALTLGLIIVEEARKIGMDFSVRIITNGVTAFSHLMGKTGLENEWWMDKKLNTARETGVSTMRFFCEIQSGMREAPAFLDDLSSYAVDGGCVTLRDWTGHAFGYAIASGNDHQCDHEVVVRAIARFLGTEIPSLI
ncbi:MAG: heme-binding protein [Oscillospiraceae bacterium]|nr:heme-binding protein [Oscillospiraceae bacterium]